MKTKIKKLKLKRKTIDSNITKSLNSDNDADSTISQYLIAEKPYRFIILIITSLLNFANGFGKTNISSISNEFQKYYNMTSIQTYLFSNIYYYVFVIMSIPSVYLIEKKSLKLAIQLSGVLTMIGSFFKAFINNSMVFAYLGQILCAAGSALIMNAPAKIASNWFRPQKRVFAASFIIAFNSLGIIFSFLLPTWYFNETNTASQELFIQAFKAYSLTGAIVSVCFSIFSILLMKSKPNIPPSISQQIQKNYNFSIKESIKSLFQNKSYILLLISFTCTNGFFNFYPVIINDYLSNYFISSKAVSYIFIFTLIGGLFGSFALSYIVDKLRIYKFPCLIINGLMIVSFSVFTALLETFNDTNPKLDDFILIICSIFYGFCLMALYSVSLDFSCELTYPIGESISIAMMHVCSQTMGAASTFVVDYFLTSMKQYRLLPNIYSIGLFVISIFALFFIKETLTRKSEDVEKKTSLNNYSRYGDI